MRSSGCADYFFIQRVYSLEGLGIEEIIMVAEGFDWKKIS